MGNRGTPEGAFQPPTSQAAAQERLEEEFHPLDLSLFETTPDAGVLAGSRATFPGATPLPVGAGREAAGALAETPADLKAITRACHELDNQGLDEVMDHLLDITAQAERAQVFALADALDRGVVADSHAASPTQWLTMKAPCLEPAQATRVVQVAQIIRDPKNTALRGVLTAGRVTVRGIQIAVRETDKVTPFLPRFTRQQTLGYFLAVAEQRPAKELSRLASMIVSADGGTKAPDDENRAREAESLSWYQLPGGLTHIRADLSPGHAAAFTAAINALAKPHPVHDQDGHDQDGRDGQDTSTSHQPSRAGGLTGHQAPRDPRTPGKRRADALMELVGAAQRTEESDAGRATTKATITLPFCLLLGTLANAGYATDAFGTVLDAGTARTLACTAQLTPMVLGTDSQPLDVGRTTRLFTPQTRAAIIQRDHGCTFPGCDRPAPWCEAHHAVPWWVGGRSNRTNGVLLCSRHHHIVHAHGYLPHITPHKVIWDLIPDQMPTQPLPPDDPLTHGPGAPPDYRRTG